MFGNVHFAPNHLQIIGMPFAYSHDMKRIHVTTLIGSFALLLIMSPGTFAADTLKMLFFYQNGCRWCNRMDKILHEPDMEGLLFRRVQVIRINVQGREKTSAFGKEGRNLAREFHVYGTPTIILVGVGEKELFRIPGALSKRDFLDLVCRYVPDVQKEAGCERKIGAM